MQWELSEFGQRLCQGSGIGELMDDLGHALAVGGDRICMLGGGQPAHIPEVDALWRTRMQQICDTPGQLEHLLGNYEPPAGNLAFRQSVANLFRNEYGWDVSADHVAVTMGGQTALFFLFNALGGRFPDGRQKRILLPLVPEYIGYADQSVSGDLFRSIPPVIHRLGEHEFKYQVDFDRLEIKDDVAAICVSRPTNPSGNVLTDAEIERLSELAKSRGIPLIIDNAYGAPFPDANFVDVNPIWQPHIVLTLSLSKIGLPGTRTGIVVGDPELIRAIASMTSIVGLANSNLGQAIIKPLIDSREILTLCKTVVKPYYREKSRLAQQWMHQYFDDRIAYRIHRSEGAFFLWLWLEGLPITSKQLYQRLKSRDVLVVPGSYFFFGLDDPDWKHRDECLRISFTMPEATVRRGFEIIADEVRHVYSEC